MTAFVVRLIVVSITFLAATSSGETVAIAHPDGQFAASISEVADRDKTGTSPTPENAKGSQVAKNKPITSRGSFQAEGMGLS